MRVVALLLAFAAMSLTPSAVLGASSGATANQKVLSCGLHVTSEDALAYRQLKCLVGTATAVSAHGMQLRPARGPVRRLRFAEDTRFETDSGEGALNGLAVRDRACVAYTTSRQTLTARIVAFNPNPRSSPCSAGNRPAPAPGDGGND